MVANRTFVFKKVPEGFPVPGKDLAVEDRPINLDEPPPPGGLVVKILYASLDPYLRGRMRDPSIAHYHAAFRPGDGILEDVIARVLKTDMVGFHEGDLVISQLPIAEYARIPANQPTMRSLPGIRKINNPGNLELAHFLGALGMPGLTAYAGLLQAGKPKAGETIFVNSAAGAVGQVVGQVAKMKGLKVIGSAGSDEKVEFITKELGFDAAFNYKKESPFHALPRLAPDGIDIDFENVGGDHLEAALDNMKVDGRVVLCGMISDYNTPLAEQKGIKGLGNVIAKQIVIEGIHATRPRYGLDYYEEHQRFMQKWLLDGSVKAKLDITEGIEHAPEALLGIYLGKNQGKAVVKID